MAIDTVRVYLKGFGMEDRIREFETSSATVQLAAEALGTQPKRIAKTLAFRKDEGTMVVVAAGDAKVDNAKFRSVFAQKARMLSPEETLEKTGHAIGGVCPFGLLPGVEVFLDVSLKRFATVYPACGSANSAIELTPEELEQTSGSTVWVDVCKDWEN